MMKKSEKYYQSEFEKPNIIVERLIRFMYMHIYSQNKAFYEKMINTKNVALLLDFTNIPKGVAKRGAALSGGL